MKIYFVTWYNTDSEQFLNYKFFSNKKEANKEINSIKKEDKTCTEGTYIFDDEPRVLEFKNKSELIKELNSKI